MTPDIHDSVEGFFPTIRRYWRDPVFRDAVEAETRRQRDRANAAIDAGIARYRNQKEQNHG